MSLTRISQAVRQRLASVDSEVSAPRRIPNKVGGITFEIVSLVEQVSGDNSGGWEVGVAIVAVGSSQLAVLQAAEAVRLRFVGLVSESVNLSGSSKDILMSKTAFEVTPHEDEDEDEAGASATWVAEMALSLSCVEKE